MNILAGIFKSVWSILSTVTITDILDIALLSFIVFNMVKIIRETRAGQLAKGLVFLFVAYFVCDIVNLKTMEFLLSAVLSNGLIAIMIMFQPELRRALERVGQTSVSRFGFLTEHNTEERARWEHAINEICSSCEELSATNTGALIVIERQTKLGEQIDTGTIIDAAPSKELLGNIFYPKTPLHDGAVIIRNGMIHAAACFLPKPEREVLINKALGSRHRAAIGMSQNSDAIIIVVSEETGTISVALNNELHRGYNSNSLHQFLSDTLLPEVSDEPQKKPILFKKKDNR